MKEVKMRNGGIAKVYFRVEGSAYPLIGRYSDNNGAYHLCSWSENGYDHSAAVPSDGDLIDFTPGQSLDDEPFTPRMMEVWNEEGDKNPRERLVIYHIDASGYCMAVAKGYEDAYRESRGYSTLPWKHCREIQPKTRPMTYEEKLGLICASGYAAKRKPNSKPQPIADFNPDDYTSDSVYFEIDKDGNMGEPQKFEVEL